MEGSAQGVSNPVVLSERTGSGSDRSRGPGSPLLGFCALKETIVANITANVIKAATTTQATWITCSKSMIILGQPVLLRRPPRS